ncbi:4-hydroxythreonine-4-phosphate dehydrogenase PdxA [Verrucomicrobiota bacterium]
MKPGIVLAVTLGDPGGIGPETALKAAHSGRRPSSLRLVLIGDRDILQRQARRLRLPMPPTWRPPEKETMASAVVNWEPEIEPGARRFHRTWKPGNTGKTQGKAAALWIRSAVAGCQAGWFHGMVTGPICKKSLKMAQVPFPGHTEYLASLTGTKRYAMMLVGGPLRVVLATRHLPLSRVPRALTRNRIIEAVRLASQAIPWLGLKPNTIGVCALNPHAGDMGLLGKEERDTIIPALRLLRRQGVNVDGPIPADVIFHQALKHRYGAVVAMYHDQGLAPLKMIAFESGVNLTLGLPIVRTSPDHGTAFDIAGKGTAHPGSMIEAIRLAFTLAKRKNPWH